MCLKPGLARFFNILFKIIALTWIFLNVVQAQYCPSEKSAQLGSLITWYTTEPKTVISDPPCINNRYEISKRNCTQIGRWVPPVIPYCRLVQRQFAPKCPYDFITRNGYCIYISKPKAWRSRCPFPNYQLVTEQQHLKRLLGLNITEFWLPVRRNQPFGKFVWYHPTKYGSNYKHFYLKKAVKHADDIHHCLIVTKLEEKSANNSTRIIYESKIVSCNSKYRHVCVYSQRSNFSPSTPLATCFPGKKFCYSLAIFKPQSESEDTHLRSLIPGRNKFCEKLATPATQLENYIIKTLVQDKTCWIGLKRNNFQMFQWENSQKFLEYTDWKLNTNFKNPHAAITKDGWELHSDQNLTCGVCEVDINKVEINLTLKPNYKLGLLILTVYSPKYFINEDKISCSSIGVSDIGLTFFSRKISRSDQSSHKIKILNMLSEKDDREVYFLIPNTKFYNYYTCKGLILPNGTEISTDKVLFGTDDFGNEYALQIIIEDFCNHPKKCDPIYNDDLQEIINKINDTLFHLIRPMKVVRTWNKNLEIILHVHVKPNNMTRVDEYTAVKNKLMYLFSKQRKITFVSLKSVFGCVEHITFSGNTKLHWDFTDIGSTTMPRELCFNSSGLPVTKTCLGDFISGVEWTQETGSCSDFEYSLVTKLLHDIYLSVIDFTIDEVVANLTSLTVESETLRPSDIYYVSQILKGSNFTNYNNGTLIIDNTVTLVNNLIGTDFETLKISTELLNSTNVILDAFENLLGGIENITLNEDGIFQVVSPYLFYQVSEVSLNNISGVMMKGNGESFLDYDFVPLKSSTNMRELIQEENLEVASFIPEEIIENIKGETNLTNLRVYISVFYNNSLFVEDEKGTMEPGSKIISVSVMGYDNYLVSPIPVLFRNNFKGLNDFSCSYWRFGQSTYEDKYPAKWAQDGGIHWNISVENIEVCGFTHLTHFALLLGEPSSSAFNVPSENLEYHDRVLSIITMICCLLSVLGILVILLTALLFKSWRQKTGTKVLLNLSGSVVMQMIVIFLADTKQFPSNEAKCIILGCILHYATIASFCWMLVVAYLQYLRFVKVFTGIRPHLVLKSCIVGWILPFLPVISLLLWDPNSYNPMVQTHTSGLCYPHGATSYISVLLPIATILIINICIFCVVIYSVTQKTVSTSNRNKSLKYNQLKLAILLFFLLGLTWIFGFLTVFKNCLVCLYLFCTTATLQGFVLFVFYVLLDTNTRKLWSNALSARLNLSRTKTTRLSNSSTTQESNGNNTNSTVATNQNRF